jgi:arylformamidase
MKIVDCSHRLHTGMQVFPGDPAVEITPALTVANEGVNVLSLHFGSQTGTHVDSPFHVRDDLATLDQIPLTQFVGRYTLVDATGLDDRAVIPMERFEAHSHFESIVLVRTDWSDYFNSDRYLAHPVLDGPTIEFLLGQGVRTIGLDFLSLDATPEDVSTMTLENHYRWSEEGGIIIENLTNLRALSDDTPFVSLLPLKLGASDGAPIRAVATSHFDVRH